MRDLDDDNDRNSIIEAYLRPNPVFVAGVHREGAPRSTPDRYDTGLSGGSTMATKPTRMQQQACDQLAEALVLITEATRLDGKAKFDSDDLGAIASKLAQASSAFSPDEIVARALERRAKRLGLPSSAAELLTLLDTEIRPLEMLLLLDDEFKALVERMQEELGEV
jgi:hypothetical protein